MTWDGAPGELTIGALSKQAGCRAGTLRYYEQLGLVPPPRRTAGGHRLYGREQVERIAFIRHARDLDFSLKEVRGLLDLLDRGDYTCAQVQRIAFDHLRDVKRRIGRLRKLQRTLESMILECPGGARRDCTIVEALFGAEH